MERWNKNRVKQLTNEFIFDLFDEVIKDARYPLSGSDFAEIKRYVANYILNNTPRGVDAQRSWDDDTKSWNIM